MKKYILIATGLMLSLTQVKAQDWDSVGSGTSEAVYALAVYNGDLYVAGTFAFAGGIPARNIAKWNGTSWSVVGSGISVHGFVYCLQVYNGNLYVGGTFDTAGGIPVNNIATWDGSNWSAVGSGISGSGADVNTLCVYNNNLMAGGSFTIPGNNIASWNGTVWSTLGLGITGGYVLTLMPYDSVFYAAGLFTTAGGNPAANISQWNGTTWSAVGSGLYGGGFPQCTSTAIYNQSLYAGGYFDSASGMATNYIARWNGVKWGSLSSAIIGTPLCMLATGGILYTGGYIYFAGGIIANNIAVWNGSNWDSVGSGFSDTGVYTLATYQSQLYAGGIFQYSGNAHRNYIAKWNTPTSIPTIKANDGIVVFPNPTTGQFTIQSSVFSQELSVEVYNMLGTKVYSQFITHNSSFIIDLSSQPNGVYLYRVISTEGNLIGQGKVVVEK